MASNCSDMSERSLSNASDRTLSDMSESAFREAFQACFEELQHTGEFAFSTTESQYVNPGLHIQGVGAVGLPLATRDAESIAAVCKQSPFGRKNETIVDETVRKTWELDATDFTCTKPNWATYLDKLAITAVETLGVQQETQPQLYKLLLYEPGAFFKAHRDTEKVPGMFGTMVVCLPSPHTGGEVVLRHGGKTQTMVTANTSEHDLCTSAWYSDVQHEICPITSGYRLVLTYNLVQTDSSITPSAAEHDRHSASMKKQLQSWLQQFLHVDHYIWPLEHQYTKAGLTLHHLKGRDASVCNALERLCSMNGVWWFLSEMTRSTKDDDYGDCYGYDEDAEGDALSTIYTPAGRRILLDLEPLAQDHVLTDLDEHYANRAADSEDEGEFLGNEGTANTLRYHDTVVVLVQKDVVIDGICTLEHDSESLSVLYELVSKDMHLSSVQRRDAMVNILKTSFRMLKRGFRTDSKHSQYTKLAGLAVEYCYSINEGLHVAELLRSLVPEDRFETPNNEQWYPLLAQLGGRFLAEQVHINQEDAWKTWLATPLPHSPTYAFIKNRLVLFNKVRQHLSPELVELFDLSMRQELTCLAEAVTTTSTRDVGAIQDLIAMLGPEACSDVIIPGLVKKPNPAFLLDFMTSLAAKNNSQGSWGSDTVQLFFKPLIPIISQTCKLTIQKLSSHRPTSFTPYPTPDRTLMEAVLKIVEICVQSGLQEEGDQLLRAILPDVANLPQQPWEMWQLVFMLVQHLLALLARQRNDRLNKVGSTFVTNVVQSAVRDLVMSRPVQPQGWERSDALRGSCSCAACRSFVDFLRDRHTKVCPFNFAQKTREHLQAQILYWEDFKFETDRTTRTHSLIITKTTNQYPREMKKWGEDIRAMKFARTSMRHEFTYELLNGDIVVISGIDRIGPAAQPAPQPLGPSTASAQNILPPPMVDPAHGGQNSAPHDMGQGPTYSQYHQQNAYTPYAPTAGTKRSANAAGLDCIDLTEY